MNNVSGTMKNGKNDLSRLMIVSKKQIPVLSIASLDNGVSYWQEKHDFFPSPVPLLPFPIIHASNCELTEQNLNILEFLHDEYS
jgi:hypothetical protein